MAKPSGLVIGAIGCAGVLAIFVIAGFVALFYFGFVQRGGVYDGLRAQLSQGMINDLVPKIELYKLEYGAYPRSLDQMAASQPRNSISTIYDPTISSANVTPREFFYRRAGCDHYYLRGLGPDGIAFTADDVVPDLGDAPPGKIGLLTRREPAAEVACSGK